MADELAQHRKDVEMRLDLVVLVMLVSWIALGYGGSELIKQHQALHACTAQVKQVQETLAAVQTERDRVNGELVSCTSQLATTQDQLAGVANEYQKVNDSLAVCIANNNILQTQVRQFQTENVSCSLPPPVQETENGGANDKQSPWVATITMLLTGTALVVKKLGAVKRKNIKYPSDYIQLTKEERQMIIHLRRKQP